MHVKARTGIREGFVQKQARTGQNCFVLRTYEALLSGKGSDLARLYAHLSCTKECWAGIKF